MQKSQKLIIHINTIKYRPIDKSNKIITPKKGKGAYGRKDRNPNKIAI